MIASSSKTGKFIAIHDIESFNKIKLLFRGYTPATIVSLTFSQHNHYIATLSERGSIHIHSMGDEKVREESIAQSFFKNTFGHLTSFTSSESSFAIARVDYKYEEDSDGIRLLTLGSHIAVPLILFNSQKIEQFRSMKEQFSNFENKFVGLALTPGNMDARWGYSLLWVRQ